MALGRKTGGRKKGTPNKRTILLRDLLDEDAQVIVAKLVEKAKEGDGVALKLCLERLIPPARESRIALALPEVTDAATVTQAQSAVIQAVTAGKITPSEGEALSSMLDTTRRTIETKDLATRIEAIEERQSERANQ